MDDATEPEGSPASLNLPAYDGTAARVTYIFEATAFIARH
jgi:hypothetical protein